MRRASAVAGLLVIACAAQAPAVGSQATAECDAALGFEFRPGVIIDDGRSTLYLMAPAGGIDAVDLSTGKRVWHTPRAAKPLALHGRGLIAQAEQGRAPDSLRLVVLDLRGAGKAILEADVPLGQGVEVAVDDAMGRAFRASGSACDDHALVEWRYTERTVSGPPPAPGAEGRVVAGVVRLDLETGQTDCLAPRERRASHDERLPARLAALPADARPRWRAGHVFATVARRSAAGGAGTVLKRWDGETGEPLPDVPLFGSDWTLRYASADGRHLLASRRVDRTADVWDWRIYSLETGAPAAQVRTAVPAAPFFLTEASVIHEAAPTGRIEDGTFVADQPLRLRAVDIATSAQRWELPLRDTAYRGPYPPGIAAPR